MDPLKQRQIEQQILRRQAYDSLLVRPRPQPGEGPKSYFMRLAEPNWLKPSQITRDGLTFEPTILFEARLLPEQSQAPIEHAYAQVVADSRARHRRLWNPHRRVCPCCLSERAVGDVGWELIFHDACPKHGVWLVDRCSNCGRHLTFESGTVRRCSCDADLAQEPVSEAPPGVIWLSQIIRDTFYPQESVRPAHLAQLQSIHLFRLILLLGAGMDPARASIPNKPSKLGRLEHSWPITSRAAEILSDWPAGFHRALSTLASRGHDVRDNGRLVDALGASYRYLLSEMRTPEFAPVYNEFCAWVESSWTGSLAKRNRALLDQIVENRQWIPAKSACEKLRISISRLRFYVETRELEAEEIISKSGRRFMVVNRLQVDALRQKLESNSLVDLRTVTESLGLSKQRMKNLLLPLFPGARKMHPTSRNWEVELGEVEGLLSIGSALPVVNIPDEGCVSLGHLLRYSGWRPDVVAQLLIAVKTGDVQPVAKCQTMRGIAAWVFSKNELTRWLSVFGEGKGTWLSTKHAATELGLSELGVLHLIRTGLLETTRRLGRSGVSYFTHREELHRFRERYLILKHVADQLGVGSKKVAIMLRGHGFHPVLDHRVVRSAPTIYPRGPDLDSVVAGLLGEKAPLILVPSPSVQSESPTPEGMGPDCEALQRDSRRKISS